MGSGSIVVSMAGCAIAGLLVAVFASRALPR
ncbi:hypothetical protein FB565_008793 [Actinoplanes lutulentus]|nr:hypothetical protein [Actinoplanes lutulentus]